jgi:single-strand DNA-binding protein
MSEAKHKNECRLAGELAKDPVTRFTPSGKKISTLTVVTKHKQWSEYHRVVCWEEAAEKAEKLSKGAFVQIVGRLQTRSWDDKQTAQKKYVTEIIAFQVAIPTEEAPLSSPKASKGGTSAARAILSPATPNIHGVPITDDDIPF